MLEERYFNTNKLKIVVNRYISRHVVRLGDLHNIINHIAFHTLHSDYFSLMNAIDMGTILSTAAPRSKLWGDIKQLGEKILKEVGK